MSLARLSTLFRAHLGPEYGIIGVYSVIRGCTFEGRRALVNINIRGISGSVFLSKLFFGEKSDSFE
jgi:hypothetical protein